MQGDGFASGNLLALLMQTLGTASRLFQTLSTMTVSLRCRTMPHHRLRGFSASACLISGIRLNHQGPSLADDDGCEGRKALNGSGPP